MLFKIYYLIGDYQNYHTNSPRKYAGEITAKDAAEAIIQWDKSVDEAIYEPGIEYFIGAGELPKDRKLSGGDAVECSIGKWMVVPYGLILIKDKSVEEGTLLDILSHQERILQESVLSQYDII